MARRFWRLLRLPHAPQHVVESVETMGNRRCATRNCFIHHTRAGEVYAPAALERDLGSCIRLNFLKTKPCSDRTAFAGCHFFEVAELPIIRALVLRRGRAT